MKKFALLSVTVFCVTCCFSQKAKSTQAERDSIMSAFFKKARKSVLSSDTTIDIRSKNLTSLKIYYTFLPGSLIPVATLAPARRD